jgi:RNA polymerase sigma-70 factor (ECF subfamily)
MREHGDADRLYREWFGRAVGVLARTFRDLDLAEEAVQDAFAAALPRWRSDGLPDEPGAWIIHAARNRAIDIIRRRRVGGERERQAEELRQLTTPAIEIDTDAGIPDERLALMFTCCHPALAADARSALTLRLVAGLTVEEIARAYLVPAPTIAQRLVRAKKRVREAGIPLSLPPDHALPERLDGVLTVLYVLFGEGHSATAGDDAVRASLCLEAIRLGRLVVALMPDEPEARGLLGLLLLTDARRPARVAADGAFIPLEHHDRARYDADRTEEGDALVRDALRGGGGAYALQGAIAALHSTAPSFEETDWPQVVALYDLLVERAPSPIVELNRALACSYAEGPAAALPILDALEARGRLAGHAPLAAARADVLRRLDDRGGAAAAYRRAIALAGNRPEREHLQARLRDLGGPPAKADETR